MKHSEISIRTLLFTTALVVLGVVPGISAALSANQHLTVTVLSAVGVGIVGLTVCNAFLNNRVFELVVVFAGTLAYWTSGTNYASSLISTALPWLALASGVFLFLLVIDTGIDKFFESLPEGMRDFTAQLGVYIVMAQAIIAIVLPTMWATVVRLFNLGLGFVLGPEKDMAHDTSDVAAAAQA